MARLSLLTVSSGKVGNPPKTVIGKRSLVKYGSSAATVGMDEWLNGSAAPAGTFNSVLAMRIAVKPGAFGAPLRGYGA